MNTMNWYHFRQNNSGGSFVHEDNELSHHVFIEAMDSTHANAIATKLGVYFDGCDRGMDCSCCGDRWHDVDESYKVDFPFKAWSGYQFNNTHKTWPINTIDEVAQFYADDSNWMGDKPEVYVHPLQGEVRKFYHRKKVNG